MTKRSSTQPEEFDFSSRKPATFADLSETSLFRNVDSEIIDLFLENDSSNQKLPRSYVCELQPRKKLALTRKGVEYLYIIVNGHLSLKMHTRFDLKDSKTARHFFIAWRGKGQVVGEM